MSNLPDNIGKQQYLAAVDSAPARYTHAGRVEHRTNKVAIEKSAEAYLALLDVQAEGAVKREQVRQDAEVDRVRLEEAVDYEESLLNGVARLAKRTTALAAQGGGLTAQALAEQFPGSMGRLEGLANETARRR